MTLEITGCKTELCYLGIDSTMTSNRQVTYLDIGLNSVSECWSNLVVENIQAFTRDPSSRTVFNAAFAIWHLHDWVWHERNPSQDSSGIAFAKFREDIITQCPELAWLRDIADAAKHRGIGRKAGIEGMRAEVIGAGFGSAPFGAAPIAGTYTTYEIVLNDGTHAVFSGVLRTAIDFWISELKGKQLPSPFGSRLAM